MESLNSSDSENKILAAFQLSKFKVFLECLNGTCSNVCCNEPYHSCLLETVCQMKNSKRLIKLLLGSAADPNINNRFFDVFQAVQLSIFISVINQLDAQNICFTISLLHSSTCFEHMCSSSGGQNAVEEGRNKYMT